MSHPMVELDAMTGAPPIAPVPEPVRQKLNECGEALSDAQWGALPPAARNRLLQLPAATAVERAAYRSLVRWLIHTFPTGSP